MPNIDPQNRGLEDDKPEAPKAAAPKIEVPKAEPPKPVPLTHITKVVAHGPGWMTVVYNDGNQYRREGGTLAWRCQNPGNLKDGDFARKHGSIGTGLNGMAVFPTVAHGKAAQRDLLFGTGSRYLSMNLEKAISIYAPDYDGNDPEAYCDYVSRHARVSYLKVLSSMTDEEKDRVLAAMQAMEGQSPGKLMKVVVK